MTVPEVDVGGIACKSPVAIPFCWRNRVLEERQKRDIWQELGLEMSDDPSEGKMRGGSEVDIGWDSPARGRRKA